MNSFLLFFTVVVGTVIIFELSNDNVPTTQTAPLKMVALSEAQKYTATNSITIGEVLLWKDCTNGTTKASLCKKMQLNGHQTAIKDLTFSKDGRWLITTDVKGLSTVWTTRRGQKLKTFSQLDEKGFIQSHVDFMGVDPYCTCMIFKLDDGQFIYFDYNTNTASNKKPIPVVAH